MMGEQSYTIIIVPNTKKGPRKVKVSVRSLSYVLLGVALCLFLGLGAMVHYIRVHNQAKKLETVRQENEELKASLEESKMLAEKLNKKIGALTRLSTKLKAAAGMPNLATRRQNNLPGMGGVTLDSAPNPQELLALEHRAETLEKSLLNLQSYVQEKRPFSTPSISPTEGFISSTFGSRKNPFTGSPDFHEGIDISNRAGTPVSATAAGTVLFAGYRGSLGWCIEIEHGQGVKTVFGHLSKILVYPGQKVWRGQEIGLMGNSGSSTAPHLHYEVRVNDQPVNPKPYLNRLSKG